jgi:hypothetical protein
MLQGSTGEIHLRELFVRVVAVFELYELRSGRQLLFALRTVAHRKQAPHSSRKQTHEFKWFSISQLCKIFCHSTSKRVMYVVRQCAGPAYASALVAVFHDVPLAVLSWTVIVPANGDAPLVRRWVTRPERQERDA